MLNRKYAKCYLVPKKQQLFHHKLVKKCSYCLFCFISSYKHYSTSKANSSQKTATEILLLNKYQWRAHNHRLFVITSYCFSPIFSWLAVAAVVVCFSVFHQSYGDTWNFTFQLLFLFLYFFFCDFSNLLPVQLTLTFTV